MSLNAISFNEVWIQLWYALACRLSLANDFRSNPSRDDEAHQQRPAVLVPVRRNRIMIAQHEKHNWHGHERVVLRSQLGLSAERRVEPRTRCGCSNHLALRRQNAEPNICRHDRPKDRSHVQICRTPAKCMQKSP